MWHIILWHPHQGLWNWDLTEKISSIFRIKPVAEAAVRSIILIDTLLLWVRALGRRLRYVGVSGFCTRPNVPLEFPVLYLDLGLHTDAEELSLMVNEVLPQLCPRFSAFGFEACRNFYIAAKAKLANAERVSLVHAAVCQKVPESGKIKLYRDRADGLGNSVYRDHLSDYEEVPALRLSDWLRSHHIDLMRNICLIRMNIEGAEVDVISDLVESGLAKYIDGYFGMWDDMSKIDQTRDDEFRGFLRKNHIHPFTFNGRDIEAPALRMKAIRYDVVTAIRIGVKRIQAR
jgi:FkbM family methyltransferase